MVYLLLALLNRNDKTVTLLAKIKSKTNVLIPLLIILDGVHAHLANGVYYALLCIILKLSACELTSGSLLHKVEGGEPV